jgi:hypothetical protein
VESGKLLTDYHDAVHQQATHYVGRLSDADLDRIVDRSWDPPVSLGVRLVSVIADDLQHAGQAELPRAEARGPARLKRASSPVDPLAATREDLLYQLGRSFMRRRAPVPFGSVT